jgi:exosortase/archaeosortase family protein
MTLQMVGTGANSVGSAGPVGRSRVGRDLCRNSFAGLDFHFSEVLVTVANPTVTWPARLATRGAVATLLSIGAMLVIWHTAYRSLEIQISAVLIDAVTSSGVYVAPQRQTVYFGLGTDHALGLRMTPECTSAFLVVPLLGVGAAMLGLRPRIAGRVLASLAVAVAVLVAVNQLRVLALVGLIDAFGRSRGYYLGHTLFGSMISVFGGAAALVLFVWLSTRTPKGARR